MSKHTPGEWKLLKFNEDERYIVTNSIGTPSFHREIAMVSFGYSEPAETEQHANAKLIAAAPELLAAADQLIGDFDPESDDRRYDGLRAAVAKATGES